VTLPEQYPCLTSLTAYTGNSYLFEDANTVVLDGELASDSATDDHDITCYIPSITKSAAGTYDERHEWTVVKTVDPLTQSAFAGETVNFNWTITVNEDVYEENFDAAGTITVVNPNAEDALVVALADAVNGNTATITGCTGGTYAEGMLTVPASGTAVCNYTANNLPYPSLAAVPKLNTATATYVFGEDEDDLSIRSDRPD